MIMRSLIRFLLWELWRTLWKMWEVRGHQRAERRARQLRERR